MSFSKNPAVTIRAAGFPFFALFTYVRTRIGPIICPLQGVSMYYVSKTATRYKCKMCVNPYETLLRRAREDVLKKPSRNSEDVEYVCICGYRVDKGVDISNLYTPLRYHTEARRFAFEASKWAQNLGKPA